MDSPRKDMNTSVCLPALPVCVCLPACLPAFILSILSLCVSALAGIQTIDSTQALFLPIGASVSLLVMFFFFDSVQVVFTICTAGTRQPLGHAVMPAGRVARPACPACLSPQKSLSDPPLPLLSVVLATIAFAFLLLPMCQYLTRPCSPQNK